MVIKNFDITLDLKKNKRINTIEVVQGDFETNIFNIEVTDDYEPLDITGTTVEILFAKPDNTTVMQDMESGVVVADAANGKITITLNTNTIAAPGVVHSELRIKEAGKIVTTARFSFIVRKAIVSNVVSSNEFPVLERLIKDAEDYLEVFPEWAGQEAQRQSNEQSRVNAEQGRVLTEQQREDLFATYEPRIADVEADLNSHKLEIANEIQDIRNALALAHYDPGKGEYVNLDQYWNSLRNGKIYTVEFNQFNISPSPLGTKKDDNVGLICEPSTNIVRGRNDYENIGLFMAIEVNGYVDENDDYHVTAIEGDSRFKRDGSNGDVWVMAMPGYIKRYSDENVWGISYSDAMHPGFEIIDEAIKTDGTIRPYLLHAKYIAGRNPIDGKLASISGAYPEYVNMSHNGQIAEFKAKGTQYSGKTSHDDFYVQLMFWLKYATTHSQSIMQGCSSYYLQYTSLVAETDVKRVIITNSQASGLLIGSCVSIGDYGAGSISTDRQAAQNYNLANRVKITSIEDLGDGNSAVYVDSESTFDTTLTTTITTYPWNTGGCDNVLGVDGSPYNNLSSKEPFIINGIEMMAGGYEVLQNLIISNNSTDNRIDVYANYDCKTYATSITVAYDLVGQLAQTNNTWKYGSKMVIPNNHPSVILITEAEGSSTTGTGDGIYTNPPSAGGTRVWRSLGALSRGTSCGLRCLSAAHALSVADWTVLGRLSATGRSRRRAGVN